MLLIIIILVLGLSIGSFINALIYRLHKKKSWVQGRSICPQCKHTLAWSDLIPLLSFIFLQGKCRYCHKKISWQYPLVELATAIVFAVIYWALYNQFGIINYQLLIINYFVATILAITFLYDLKYYLILDEVILPAILMVFFANLLLGRSLKGMLLAALVVGIFFLLQLLISQGKWIGAGDLRIAVFMGVVLGWPYVLVAVFLAYIFGSIIGLILVALKIKKIKSKIPFAAFLCPATFVVMLWGEALLRWYFKILK